MPFTLLYFIYTYVNDCNVLWWLIRSSLLAHQGVVAPYPTWDHVLRFRAKSILCIYSVAPSQCVAPTYQYKACVQAMSVFFCRTVGQTPAAISSAWDLSLSGHRAQECVVSKSPPVLSSESTKVKPHPGSTAEKQHNHSVLTFHDHIWTSDITGL